MNNPAIPRRWLILIPILLLAGGWALWTLRLQKELLPVFPQELPSVQGLRVFQENFSSAQEVMVVVDAASPKAREASELLGEKIRPQIAQLPNVESASLPGEPRPEFISEALAWTIAHLPPERFAEFQRFFTPGELQARLSKTEAQLGGSPDPEMIARLRVDPFGLLEWLKLQPEVELPPLQQTMEKFVPRIMVVRAQAPLEKFEDCQAFVEEIRRVLRVNATESATFRAYRLTGRPVFVAETASQMRSDMIRMFAVATVLVSLAFWFFYRSLVPLLGILVLQLLAVTAGVIAARVIFGELNILSMAFAVILLGVSMDYCILVYHFLASHRGGASGSKLQASRLGLEDTSHDSRQETGNSQLATQQSRWTTLRRGIWLSAATTAASFSILCFSSFPGFRQLALLIGVGLLAMAAFATDLLPAVLGKLHPVAPDWIGRGSDKFADFIGKRKGVIRIGWIVTCVLAICVICFSHSYQFYDSDPARLRPKSSEAAEGLQLLLKANQSGGEPFPLILEGASWSEIRSDVLRLKNQLKLKIDPSPAWLPAPELEEVNRAAWAPGLGVNIPSLLNMAGFKAEWGKATQSILERLDRWKMGKPAFEEIEFLLRTTSHVGEGKVQALVRVRPEVLEGADVAAEPAALQMRELSLFWKRIHEIVPSALPASWPLLGVELNQVARGDFQRLSLWMVVAVIGLCWVAHRSFRLVLLNLFALGSSLLGLLILLFLSQDKMTLLSLLAVPLLIGLVIDYSLHLLLSLEQEEGNLKSVMRHLGAPVVLTGLSSVIGFGAPLISQQPGLQNFGWVMDLGIVAAVVTGLVLLPSFYFKLNAQARPSPTLYRSGWFSLASTISGWLGRATARRIARFLAFIYGRIHATTRENVRKNISIVVGTRVRQELVDRTFSNFGASLADYFVMGNCGSRRAFEWTTERVGLEHLIAAREEGRGAILVTAHLSLFEYGGAVMEQLGLPTLVITRPEPSAELTHWRTAFRKRWGADTLELGDDQFTFLDVVHKLKEGKFVTMLVDRPQSEKVVWIDFPHGKVAFSVGAVLLSLISQAPILTAMVVETPSGGYRLEVQPPIRPVWLPTGRAETLEFYTQELARAFVPIICKHPDQWYHFVQLGV